MKRVIFLIVFSGRWRTESRGKQDPEIRFDLPGNVDPATKYVLGWVDSGNAIWEPDGRNNLVP